MQRLRVGLLLLAGVLFFATPAPAYEGKVVDAQTKAPIEGATVTLNEQAVRTGKDGGFRL